ncbi:MAG TPA: type II CAAX endopeptidase family protein [Rhizomicrobium sp.]|jgi:membrane protease YdiL (CAAX protease family)|nr:type II CAAX endopeptidase family protein [Rhizomicrobium sp.]
MTKFIRSLSPRAEFCIVVVPAFGLFVYASLSFVLRAHVPLTYAGLAVLPSLELVLMVLLAAFLRLRGWTLCRIGLVPEFNDIAFGVLLFAAAYAAWFLTFNIAVAVAPDVAQIVIVKAPSFAALGIPLWILAVPSLINTVFEEAFETGYIVSALRRGGNIWPAIHVSVGIRLLCHLYQGPLGVLSTIPLGLIFAYWYARTGRLWPLILAHAAMDMLALVAYSRM